MIHPRWTAFRLAFADVGADLDVDGMPAWPIAKMRINGFDDGLTYPSVWAGSPPSVTITCNGGVDDGVAGSSYSWYLSQRTDDDTKQSLSIAYPHPTGSHIPDTTGTVIIRTTAAAARLVPSLAYTQQDGAVQLFRHCYLYVQRNSDSAIQVANLSVAIARQPS